MFKRIAKTLVRATFPVSSRMCIDYVYEKEGTIVFSGWYFNKDINVPRKIQLSTENGSQIGLNWVFFKRDDVANHFSLPSNDHAFGFIGIINEGGLNISQMKASVGGKNYSLARSKPLFTDSLGDLVSQSLTEAPTVIEFLEGFGFKVPTESGNTKSARIKDKDISKIKDVLMPVSIHEPDFFQNCKDVYIPKLQKIWKARVGRSNQVLCKPYGEQPNTPSVSVIIPLYGRIDFLQHQIAHFSKDPFLQNAELVYVLDDPSLTHELSVVAEGVYQTFRMPFKVVFSSLNLGFAGANNLGVNHATSEKILLLNSDVIPKTEGWLEKLLADYDSLSDCAVLGAVLVYEDETIQHLGMEFRKDASYPGIWMNHHPYKGVPFALVDQFQIKEVPLVTGACMLMDKADFTQVEGFDQNYILGDFEDSDLCLKLRETGKKVYISGRVELYHLERLSQDLVDSGDWKFKLTMINGVYQSSRWSRVIEGMV